MADIKKITLPDGSQYDLKDDAAFHRTAGSSELLTGDIYISSDTLNDRNIYIVNGNNTRGVIQMTANGSLVVKSTEDDGTNRTGLNLNSSGSIQLYGNGSGAITLRPNGNGTNQVSFSTAGQQTGGHPVFDDPSPSGNKSVSANTWVTLASITSGISSSGVYFVDAGCTYQPSGDTAHTPYLRIANANLVCAHYHASSGGRPYQISGIVTGVSSISFDINTETSSLTATASSIHLRVVRLS